MGHPADFRIDPARLALLGLGGRAPGVLRQREVCRPENRIPAVVSMFGEYDLVLRAAEEPCSVDGRVIPRPNGGSISGGPAAFLGFNELTPENERTLRQAFAVNPRPPRHAPYLLR